MKRTRLHFRFACGEGNLSICKRTLEFKLYELFLFIAASVSNGSREKIVGQVDDELEEKSVFSKRRLSCAEGEKADRKKRRGTVSCH